VREFAGRVAVITGAASGIGRALALELARAGAELALSDVEEAGLADTASAARELGARTSLERVDVADRAAVHAHAARVMAEHGRVNLVVNNAGVALDARIEDVSYEDLQWLFAIDFWGVVHGTKAFLPLLRQSGEGHVVNVSSVFGLIAVPGQGAYNAAKFAVRGFTECLRMELELEGAPVSATCVHPGGIRTNIARSARIVSGPGSPSREELHARFDAVARTPPEAAARAILRGVRRNARRVLIGADARAVAALQRLLPARYQALVVRQVRRREQTRS
jgi:NAD(P)-dependent dehydrogenase (short-subunit alcohol dehydrogenase family)